MGCHVCRKLISPACSMRYLPLIHSLETVHMNIYCISTRNTLLSHCIYSKHGVASQGIFKRNTWLVNASQETFTSHLHLSSGRFFSQTLITKFHNYEAFKPNTVPVRKIILHQDYIHFPQKYSHVFRPEIEQKTITISAR